MRYLRYCMLQNLYQYCYIPFFRSQETKGIELPFKNNAAGDAKSPFLIGSEVTITLPGQGGIYRRNELEG